MGRYKADPSLLTPAATDEAVSHHSNGAKTRLGAGGLAAAGKGKSAKGSSAADILSGASALAQVDRRVTAKKHEDEEATDRTSPSAATRRKAHTEPSKQFAAGRSSGQSRTEPNQITKAERTVAPVHAATTRSLKQFGRKQTTTVLTNTGVTAGTRSQRLALLCW